MCKLSNIMIRSIYILARYKSWLANRIGTLKAVKLDSVSHEKNLPNFKLAHEVRTKNLFNPFLSESFQFFFKMRNNLKEERLWDWINWNTFIKSFSDHNLHFNYNIFNQQ